MLLDVLILAVLVVLDMLVLRAVVLGVGGGLLLLPPSFPPLSSTGVVM